jgi:hypothetical protein
MKKSLTQLRKEIRAEVPYVDVKPFSHNIIGCLLRIIDRDYGKDEANRAIKDCGLLRLGWSMRE